MTDRPRPLALTPLLALLASAGCRDAGPAAEITARRTASRPASPVVPGASARERFGSAPPRAAPAAGSDELLAYDLPEGWRLLPPTRERLLNLQPGGDPDAVCALSFLPGSAGGLEANVNRWLGQFGAEPLAGDVIRALPTHPMLGRDATLVSVEGTFTDMSGPSRPDFALLGLLISEPTGSLFLKLTGPVERLAAERERFLAFASSLRLPDAAAEAHGPDDGHDHGAEGDVHPSDGAHFPGDGHDHGAPDAPFAFDAPEGWRLGAHPMREVTFELGPPGSGAECYVTSLARDGGGLLANFNRWAVQQMGRAPLTELDLAELPTVELLGERVPLLALEGDFTGMDGTTRAAQGMLGTALVRPDTTSVFVKLTGPAELVRAERERFVAFVASLEERP